ncbi:high affinity immunoglobulin epsilon receptor subunit alpha isoform X2 [Ailuropoda melanoleuca]|uniref:high affinity immunoglobulin epsilon receptor subunit alpha isoform X2 n=1 Tax=Ailuropoda melanoleuca TaxID=9646 RepID=UPI0014944CC3|nr:high affinity immunoglobulin epsilon receptor subunit alpha isoform X2 [Ailuropoda melanoleuca]
MIQKTFPSPFWLQVYFKALSLQSSRHLGATEEMPIPMGGPALLWMALLLCRPDGMSAVSLNPPWNRILKDDNVTLICHENNSLEVNSAVWTHNNIRLEETSSRLNIVKARIQDSGEYRCQNKESIPSEPVYLGVVAGWLLLQASAEVVTEGESFHIRCHGWRNQNVSKVTYYRNGVALKYWYDSIDVSITNVTVRDSGSYFCTGCIRRQNHTSDPLNITVKKDSPDQNGHQSKYSWLQFLIPSLVVILFAVDTGLLVLTQQQLALLLKTKRTRKSKKPDPEKS